MWMLAAFAAACCAEPKLPGKPFHTREATKPSKRFSSATVVVARRSHLCAWSCHVISSFVFYLAPALCTRGGRWKTALNTIRSTRSSSAFFLVLFRPLLSKPPLCLAFVGCSVVSPASLPHLPPPCNIM